jgi:hypothetical protein
MVTIDYMTVLSLLGCCFCFSSTNPQLKYSFDLKRMSCNLGVPFHNCESGDLLILMRYIFKHVLVCQIQSDYKGCGSTTYFLFHTIVCRCETLESWDSTKPRSLCSMIA